MESRDERYYTAEEYLALEEAAPQRHEYYDGRIYAMTGSSTSHSRIAGNVFGSLHLQLRGRRCEVFNSDIKVHIEASGLYTYPDVSALCGEPRFESTTRGILLNPMVLVEVLSPSTESYDRGEKFAHYTRIPSLREYVLIAQDRVRVDRFTRADSAGAEWAHTAADRLDLSIELPSVECVLALRDVYERVDLPPRPLLRAIYERPEGVGYSPLAEAL
jgi:Uma2 family endonuclease